MIQLSQASCDPVKPPVWGIYNPTKQLFGVIMHSNGEHVWITGNDLDLSIMTVTSAGNMQRPPEDPQDTDFYDRTVGGCE